MLHGSDPRTHTPSRIAVDLLLERNTLTELVPRAAGAGSSTRTSYGPDARSKRILPTVEGTRRYFAAVTELRPERARLLELLQEAAAFARELEPAGAHVDPLLAQE